MRRRLLRREELGRISRARIKSKTQTTNLEEGSRASLIPQVITAEIYYDTRRHWLAYIRPRGANGAAEICLYIFPARTETFMISRLAAPVLSFGAHKLGNRHRPGERSWRYIYMFKTRRVTYTSRDSLLRESHINTVRNSYLCVIEKRKKKERNEIFAAEYSNRNVN